MSDHIFKSHNKTVLLYHLVFPAKYRRKVFNKEVEKILVETCMGISERFEINFLEIGNDEDHVHFLIQGIPKMPVSRIVQIIKSITAREIFSRNEEIKKMLWGRKLVDKWILCKYSWTIWQRRDDSKLCKESRKRI